MALNRGTQKVEIPFEEILSAALTLGVKEKYPTKSGGVCYTFENGKIYVYKDSSGRLTAFYLTYKEFTYNYK